jgi:hypothetical protein
MTEPILSRRDALHRSLSKVDQESLPKYDGREANP